MMEAVDLASAEELAVGNKMVRHWGYDEIEIGQKASYVRRLEERDLVLFAAVSGDRNPLHLDANYAATTPFNQRIAHGMWTAGLISAALAMELPGPGGIYLGQTLEFRAPVFVGDTITVRLEVLSKRDKNRILSLSCDASNQDDRTVVRGEARVIAPEHGGELPCPQLPDISTG